MNITLCMLMFNHINRGFIGLVVRAPEFHSGVPGSIPGTAIWSVYFKTFSNCVFSKFSHAQYFWFFGSSKLCKNIFSKSTISDKNLFYQKWYFWKNVFCTVLKNPKNPKYCAWLILEKNTIRKCFKIYTSYGHAGNRTGDSRMKLWCSSH